MSEAGSDSFQACGRGNPRLLSRLLRRTTWRGPGVHDSGLAGPPLSYRGQMHSPEDYREARDSSARIIRRHVKFLTVNRWADSALGNPSRLVKMVNRTIRDGRSA